MPLYNQDGREAWENLRKNKYAGWPSKKRGGERLSPIAIPAFSSNYCLSPETRVFTIGSCFARNIEEALSDIGLDVVSGKFAVPETEWEGRANGILNKYHPYAMLNELVWALEEDCPYPVAHGLIEVADGQWIDLHVPGMAKSVSYARALERRVELDQLYKQIRQCSLVLLTPGLVEAWWDKEAGWYTDRTVPRGIAAQYGNRFEHHVLSYDDVYQAFKQMIDLLTKNCPPDLRIFITVSPVPLAATFTAKDIFIANTYAKSVLRAAVEQVVAEHAHVEYFPSFEAITLSVREQVYGDDYIHVKDAAVRGNILRFVSALGLPVKEEQRLPTSPSHRVTPRIKTVRGMVSQQITDRLITGWAFSPGSEKIPVTVRLLVNGETVGTCLCNRMRRFSKARNAHPTGLCGFSFKVDQELHGGEEVRVQDAETGQELHNSPFVYQTPTS